MLCVLVLGALSQKGQETSGILVAVSNLISRTGRQRERRKEEEEEGNRRRRTGKVIMR